MPAGTSIDLVCFDLDGVLADSAAVIGGCLDQVCLAEGADPLSPGELQRMIGPPLLAALADLLASRGLDPSGAPRWMDAYRGHYAAAYRSTPRQPGVEAMLDGVAGLGLPMVVVTSKPQPFAEPLVAAMGLGRYFGRVEGPDLTEAEPKSVTLARALEAGGVTGAQAVMVGDRFHDVEAALANGVLAVGVTWGIGDREELHEAGADTVIDHPGQLVDLLRSWNDRVA